MDAPFSSQGERGIVVDNGDEQHQGWLEMTEDGNDVERRGYRRVLLKLGGEMFGGGALGVDPDVVPHRGPRRVRLRRTFRRPA